MKAMSRTDGLPAIVTIGTFDGVHRGHQHLLKLVHARAVKIGGVSVAVTFEPSPAQLFNPDRFDGRLTTPEQKVALIRSCGIDHVLVLPFTRDLARLSPEAFLQRLGEEIILAELWVGSDFALGHKRAGDVPRLREIGADMGFTVNAIERVGFDGLEASSSTIRRLVADGVVDEAARLLGYRYAISGEVIRGSQVGRTIGYPTANVALPADLVLPADGIYATYARIGSETVERPAMTYIGTRPALNTGSRLIETHLLDFNDDLYGRMLTTSFVTHLRPDADFPGVDALVAQLQRDEEDTRSVLGLSSRLSERAAANRGND